MFSKFSVLTKLFKCSNFKQNGLGSMMTSRRCFTKNHTTTIIPHQTKNIASIRPNNDRNFQVFRNMSSSNNKGDDQQIESSKKTNIIIQKPKKKFLRRRSKVKSLNASQMKCKRCKTKKKLEMETAKLVTDFMQRNNDLPSKKDVKIPEVSNNNPYILQSHLPSKKVVHVEFMESQNLKDFNLNKSPSSELIKTDNAIMDTHKKPINSVNDQTPSNVKSIDVAVKNTIHNLETQHLTKSNLDYQNNKNNLKSEQKDVLQASKSAKKITNKFPYGNKIATQNISIEKGKSDLKKSNSTNLQVLETKDSVTTSNNYLLPARDAVHKTISDDKISNQNKSAVFKKSEHIRILYQAHPQRKTKIKIPKCVESKKTTQLNLSEQHDQDKIKKDVSVIQPTKPGANQIKISFNPKTDSENNKIKLCDKTLEPMNDATLDIKMKPLSNIGKNLLKIPTSKKDLDSEKTEMKSEITEESTKRTALSNNANTILSTSTNPKIEVAKNQNTNKVTNISGCIHKIIHSDHANKTPTNSLRKSGCSKNTFGEYMAPNKLKDAGKTLKIVNPVSKVSRPSSKESNHKKLGTETLKTNKLTKSRSLNRSSNHGGSMGGDGGDKTAVNKEKKTATKARRSTFWRTISLTILPLILGLTVYSNVGAAEMFKRMRYANSSEDPLSMKLLPTRYGKKSKNKQADLKEIESNEKK